MRSSRHGRLDDSLRELREELTALHVADDAALPEKDSKVADVETSLFWAERKLAEQQECSKKAEQLVRAAEQQLQARWLQHTKQGKGNALGSAPRRALD